MILVHQSSPQSYLKAALLFRLHKGLVIPQEELERSLFFTETPINVDNYTLSHVHDLYREVFGKVPWLEQKGKLDQLYGRLFYASRHKDNDRHQIILQALGQALAKGIDYVLAKVSLESRKLYTIARQVSVELQRVKGFARFTPIQQEGQQLMVARVELEHRVGDLALRYFMGRFQGSQVIIKADGQVYYHQGKKIMTTSENEFPTLNLDDRFAEFWDAYYDTQWIEGRLNPKLAQKHLPKKYWNWVREGEKLDLPKD